MWTLKAADIAYLAALTAVITFLRDLRDRRKKARTEAELEPAQAASMVLANARSAMELQSSTVAALRVELEARNRVIREQGAAMAQKDVEIKAAEQREQRLLLRIGELDREVEILRGNAAGKGSV